MTKSDLIMRLTVVYPYISAQNIEQIISIITNSISNALSEGKRVELRGFGTFSIKNRKASVKINPKTKQIINTEAKKYPHFRAAKKFKTLLNDGNPTS